MPINIRPLALAILLIAMQPGLTAAPANALSVHPPALKMDIDNLVPKIPTYEQTIAPQLARRDQQIAQAKVQAEQARVAAQKEEQRQAQLAIEAQPPPIVSASPDKAAILALAQSLAAQRGWTGQQWLDLITVGNMESGWNPYALNASSGACGIPQALPCDKITDHSVQGQITWLLDYISERYSTPSVALSHEYAFGWY